MEALGNVLVELSTIGVAQGGEALDPSSAWWFFGFLAFVGLVSWRLEAHRRDRWRAKAAELGLRFTRQDDGALWADLEGASFWSRIYSTELSCLLTGTLDGEEVTVFEGRLNRGRRSLRFSAFTVVLGPTLPAFDLRPEGVLDHLGHALGVRDIDFDDHPVFSDTYLLRSDDEVAVRRLFGPTLLEHFENARFDLTVESFGGRLILTTHRERIDPDDVDGFLDEGLELARLIRQALRRVEK